MKTNNLLGIGIGLTGAYLLLRQRPATLKGFGTLGLAPAYPISYIKAGVQRIATELSQEVSQASALTGVPAWIIVAIAANEIGDFKFTAVNHAMNDPAAGVMQQTYGAVVDTIRFAKADGIYTSEVENFIRGKMGQINYNKLLDAVKKQTPDFSLNMTQYLVVPEFNLVVGSLMLRILLKRATRPDGSINLAKLATTYNFGYYDKFLKNGDDPSAEQIYARIPAGRKASRAYIKNVPGEGGYFDQAKRWFGVA